MVKYLLIKRFFDLIFSFLFLVIAFPFLLIIYFIIFFNDGKPVFYIQKRVGLSNKKFRFYKFRSMPKNTTLLPSDKIGEIKLTNIGKFLRRFSLDELPQILNILKGDMSFVGPRPCIESQIKLIELRNKNKSINSLPGLTGLAQIRAYDFMSVNEKAKFDGIYHSKISFRLDILILFSTFLYLIKPPPKY